MQPVRAYLDAGSASLFVQIVLGGFAAVAVTAKLYWRRLLVFLHIRKPEDDEAQAAETQVTATAAVEQDGRNGSEAADPVVADTSGR
jgi:hypothetical protein